MGVIADIYIKAGTTSIIASEIEKAIQHEIITNKLENITVKDVNVLSTVLSTKEDIANLRTELKSDIVNLRTELKNDINNLRTELKSDIVNLRTEFKEDNHNLEKRLTSQIYKMAGITTVTLGTLMTLFKFLH